MGPVRIDHPVPGNCKFFMIQAKKKNLSKFQKRVVLACYEYFSDSKTVFIFAVAWKVFGLYSFLCDRNTFYSKSSEQENLKLNLKS